MRKNQKRAEAGAEVLEALQRDLVGLYDDLTETFSWTALLFDGICGIVAENQDAIGEETKSGMRFAAMWLKQRNQLHAEKLQAVCGKLRGIQPER